MSVPQRTLMKNSTEKHTDQNNSSVWWHDEIFWRIMHNELLGISQNNNFSNETYIALKAA